MKTLLREVMAVTVSFPALFFAQEYPVVHYATEKEVNRPPGLVICAVYSDRLNCPCTSVRGIGLLRPLIKRAQPKTEKSRRIGA